MKKKIDYIAKIGFILKDLDHDQILFSTIASQIISIIAYTLFITFSLNNVDSSIILQTFYRVDYWIQNYSFIVTTLLPFSILIKFTHFAIVRKQKRVQTHKKIFIIICMFCEQTLWYLDLVLFYCMILQKWCSFYKLYILAFINLLYCFFIKCLHQILSENYSLLNELPLRHRPNHLIYVLKETIIIIIIISVLSDWSQAIKLQIGMLFAFCLIQLKYELQQIPYLIKQIRKLKLIKMSLICGLSICQLIILLLKIRLNSLLISLFIFIALTAFNYQNSKIENTFSKNISQMDQIDECVLKLQYFYQLSLSKDKQANYKCTLTIKNHLMSCNYVDCLCKNTKKINLFQQCKVKYQLNEKQKIFFKYFTLILSQEIKMYFSNNIISLIYYISALFSLNSYPKILNEIIISQKLCQDHIVQSTILKFLRLYTIQQMELNIKQDKKTNIQKIKHYQMNLKNLNQQILLYCRNKSKTWNKLANGNVESQYFQYLLQTDCTLRQTIISIYTQMIQQYHCNQLSKLMLKFSRFIARDTQLQKTIKNYMKRSFLRSDNIQINGKMMSLMENDKVSLIKVSCQLKTLGNIKWYNKNTLNLFGYKSEKKIIGESVEIFMPNIFKTFHQQYMKKWYENPNETNKINNFTQVYLNTLDNDFSKAKLYLKLIYSIESFEMIGLIYEQNKDDKYIIVDDNLDIVNKALFLHDILLQKGIVIIKKINLAFTSNDFVKYLIDNPKRLKTEFKITLRMQKSYDEQIQTYKEDANRLKISNKSMNDKSNYQQYHKLNLYYTELNPIDDKIDIQLQINYNQIYIYGKKYMVLKCTNWHSVSTVKIITDYKSDSQSEQRDENFYFYSDLTSVSTISQFSTLRNKQHLIFGKLESKRLYSFKKFYFFYLSLFMICLIIRIVLSNLHVVIFVQLNNADSTISDTMQLSEFLYDTSLVFYSQYKHPKLSQFERQFYVNQSQYLQSYIINLAEDNNLNSNKRNQFSNINIFQYLFDFLNSSYLSKSNIKMNNNIFLKQWVVNAKKVRTLIFNHSNNIMALKSFQQMNANFIPLMQMNHYLIYKYQSLGTQNINTLYMTNFILITVQIIVILMMILQLNSYLYYRQVEKFEFLEIFTVISNLTINKYAIYYEICNKCYDKINQYLFQRISPNNCTINVKCNYKKKYISYGYIFSILIFTTFIIWQAIDTFKTQEFVYPAYNGMTLMNQIMDSQNYLIEGIIRVKEMLLNVTNGTQINIKLLNDTIYQEQLDFVETSVKIESVINNYMQNGKQQLLPILIENVCNIINNTLTIWQYNDCVNINPPILSSGIQSSMNFFQRQISDTLEKFSKNQTYQKKQQLISNRQFVAAQKIMFYQFRIYQAIQAVILKMIQSFANNLLFIVEFMTIISCLVIILAFFIGVTFFKNEKKKYEQLCKYILCIPDEEIKSNKSIQILINKLKQQSLSQIIKL